MYFHVIPHQPDSLVDFGELRQLPLSLIPSATSLYVVLSIHDDTTLELDETFNVTMNLDERASQNNITLNETSVQVTIMDSDEGRGRCMTDVICKRKGVNTQSDRVLFHLLSHNMLCASSYPQVL